jgi:hypothetical protein
MAVVNLEKANIFDDFADRVFEAAWNELVLPIK